MPEKRPLFLKNLRLAALLEAKRGELFLLRVFAEAQQLLNPEAEVVVPDGGFRRRLGRSGELLRALEGGRRGGEGGEAEEGGRGGGGEGLHCRDYLRKRPPIALHLIMPLTQRLHIPRKTEIAPLQIPGLRPRPQGAGDCAGLLLAVVLQQKELSA